ncbi:PHD finger protein 3 [Cricetulus griseus]
MVPFSSHFQEVSSRRGQGVGSALTVWFPAYPGWQPPSVPFPPPKAGLAEPSGRLRADGSAQARRTQPRPPERLHEASDPRTQGGSDCSTDREGGAQASRSVVTAAARALEPRAEAATPTPCAHPLRGPLLRGPAASIFLWLPVAALVYGAVVGLDDIMDEGVVKESGNDTIDEEELILPNRSLRDRVEDNSVRSPRKSPRLMAQEQVRSLRQSTIAKRSNAAPLSTKKPPGKTVSSPKVGVKPSERCQSKEDLYTALKSEYPKENRRSSRHAEPIDVVPEVSASSVDSSVSPCVEMKDEAELDSKHACNNNQGELNVPSHELNCPLLSESCASVEEKKNETLMECKSKTDCSPLFKFSDKEEEQNDVVSGEMDDTIEERSAVGKLEQEAEEIKLPCEGDQMTEEPGPSDVFSDSACTDKNRTEKNEAAECHLELKSTVALGDKAENSLQRNQMETSLGYCEDMASNDVQLQSTEFHKSNLEDVDTCAFEPESTTLENTICDVPDQNSKQLNITQSIKVDSHETADLQDDRSSLEPKSIKSKHIKSNAKQSMTTETPRKTVAVKHEVVHSKTKSNVKSVKRNADEPEPQHDLQRPVKVRKGQLEKDLKNQSCNSGVKSVKSQAHSVLKKTSQDQNVMQVSKPLTHSLSDKLHGHSGSSKEPHPVAQSGHSLHSSQKLSHKPQQQAPVVKATSHGKDEHEHPGSEHLKEEDKLKLKKPEKNLQPRQRRSSRSFSLDEPPLFIPDNIATVKREGFMVGCGRCDDWFHGDCVGLSLSQAQQMGEEDKEYVCVRCCAEEDKKTDISDTDILEDQTTVEAHSEEKTMECEKLGSSKHMVANDKNKYMDDAVKHKVKILKRTIEMIEKEQREVERRPITKITHKGEIEIESDAPMKEQEATMEMQEPSANKSLEKTEGSEKQKEEVDSTSKDTTSQHRQHLFDLNCKICIGRMAPPVDDLSPKNVKVVVGGARKHSDNEAESIADALSSTTNILASEFFEEEKQESPKSTFSPAPRPEMPGTVEVESTFLARLNFIWKGFINMPSVAKFVTKAYPVSGSPEYLTEEICVVRFTPVTEEDQISYTLLFAYFSSRKRYGVAANNMKQVKDMYLIPLGAADKIPHPLVPFDGPGLELHRPNLLLGLIIRQKLKRPHSASAGPSHTTETPETAPVALPPDKKGKMESSMEETAEEENDFFNSFTTVLHKQRNKPLQSLQEDLPTTAEPLMEVSRQEPPKPLRFLPGVLIGWENQPSTLELANKPLPVDDILQSLLGTTGQVFEQAQPVGEQSTLKEIPFISDQTSPKLEKIDKVEVTEGEAKEIKVKVDNSSESTGKNSGVEETSLVGSSSISPGPLTSLSLRGKPPDVSTEAFLTNLSKQEETVENKERTLKRQLLQEQESTLQDNRTSNNSPCRPSTGKGNIDGSAGCSESLIANTRSPQFINLKRDPRQAAGRSQQTTSESKEAESCRNGDKNALPGPSHSKEPLAEPVSGEGKLSSVEKNSCVEQNDDSEAAQNPSSVENLNSSQTEQANPLQEDILTQNIETVNPFRRGSATASSHFEAGSTCQSEFPSKSINFTSRSTSPRASASFSSMRPQQPSVQHLKSSPPGFPFPAPPNFPPQSVFGFPPHLPPPLLPPPGFGFPQNPMVPWPPVHLPGQPQRMMGPLSQASRYK